MPKVELEELSQTPEFSRLTPKQKMFVATYISNGYNTINAVRTAYKCKNDNSAQIMSYALFRSFNIAMTLTLHFGEEPINTFCEQLARDINKGRLTKEQLKAYELYAEVKGWKKSAIVRAYEIAKEMGYGPAQRNKRDPGSANLKVNVGASKIRADKEDGDFDLSEFENQ